jgi:hypothetical protein
VSRPGPARHDSRTSRGSGGRPQPPVGRQERDRLGVQVAAGAVALSLVVWIGGGLMTLTTTGRWHEVPVIEAPVLLLRMMAHPNRPKDAWPPVV